jgi:hypothetical protein
MAKRKKKISAEQAAFDERTRMIREFIADFSKRIEEKKAAQAKPQG